MEIQGNKLEWKGKLIKHAKNFLKISKTKTKIK